MSTPTIALPAGYAFSADPARLDHPRVHELLTSYAFWAADRTRAVQEAVIAGSRNYGVYSEAGEQVGYARVVTDAVTFAWLADVVVDLAHRGRGLGHALVAGVVADLEPLGLRRVALKASDEGRRVYEKLGWTPLVEAETWMERRASTS
ncbi:GNAT family N-acetyltransferase [Xylanimonas oleitrophica]|uniref:GNAT family N-acetyltransferase n=1 Tax=Xylanimonas oleitrophica TaxID=2607479 RepID=A0A2W5Y3E0_9MICO|nr:GNAT family N-acetyltransferase [Xylanimonas oleitrophica]PZR52294.1 GNAT family N-acetyltransferase [Xylanimonas oleitrophica]